MTPQTEAALVAALQQIALNLNSINNKLGHITTHLSNVAAKTGR
jgi:hypothetical protein